MYVTKTFSACFLEVPDKKPQRLLLDELRVFRAKVATGVQYSPNHAGPISAKTPVRDLSLYEARSSFGEWSGIFEAPNGDIVVASDSFGYAPLYLTVQKGRNGKLNIAVANCVSALTEELHRRGAKTRFDPVYASFLFGSATSFTDTVMTDGLANGAIKLCEPGEVVYISASGWTVKNLYSWEARLSTPYHRLIQTGVDRAVASMEKIAHSLSDGQGAQIRLSGGKDSRAVLAIAVAAGLDKRLEVFSVKPTARTSKFSRDILNRDWEIAEELRKYLGMPRAEPKKQVMHEVPPSEYLLRWQRYRSNYNFKFRSRNALGSFEQPYFELYGGSGETFRTFWSVFFENLVALKGTDWSAENSETNARDVFRWLYGVRGKSSNSLKEVENRFVRDLRLDQFNTFADAVDDHYRRFRNRGHFSIARAAAESNVWVSMPLSQPEFVQASKLLPVEDRRDGRILFDIIEYAEKSLNSFAFESGAWPRRFGNQKSIAMPRNNTASHTSSTCWNENRPSSMLRGENKKRPRGRFNEREWSQEYISQTAAQLSGVPDFHEFFTDSFQKHMKNNVDQSDGATLGKTVAKLQSIRDTVVGLPADIRLAFTVLNDDRLSEIVDGFENPVLFPQSLRQDSEPIVLGAEVFKVGESSIKTIAVVKSGDPSDFEFAFYLYVNGKRIDVAWYSPEVDHIFEVHAEDGAQLDVIVFARVRGADDPSVILDSRRTGVATGEAYRK